MQGQITLPLVTGIFGYKEGEELRIVASRVALGTVTGVYRMDTELRVNEVNILSLLLHIILFSFVFPPLTFIRCCRFQSWRIDKVLSSS